MSDINVMTILSKHLNIYIYIYMKLIAPNTDDNVSGLYKTGNDLTDIT